MSTTFTELDATDVPRRRKKQIRMVEHTKPDANHKKLRYLDRECGCYLKPSKIHVHMKRVKHVQGLALLPRWLSTRY